MWTFYYAPRTIALASHIMLEEAGAAYQPRLISFPAHEQRSEPYLAINPKGRVPSLVTPQGVLTETLALSLFIAQTHPEKRLAPTDPFALAEALAFASYLATTVHVAHAHMPRGTRWADQPASLEDMRTKSHANYRDCFALIERKYLRGPWAMGEDFTFVDAHLYTLARWLPLHEIDIADFPRVADHFRRMNARAGVKRALQLQAD